MRSFFWMMMSAIVVIFPIASEEPFYYFIPPKNWDVVDPSKLSPMFKIAFVEHSGKIFKPSLNLGIQKTTASLTEYVEAAKQNHLSNRNKKWSELGIVKTHAGVDHLSQIDEKTQMGEIRSMQCIFMHKQNVYVITAVALREDFVNYHNEFLKAFESFSIDSNALSSLNSSQLQESYRHKTENLLHEWTLFLAENRHPKDPQKAFEDKRFRRGLWKDFEKFLSKASKSKVYSGK